MDEFTTPTLQVGQLLANACFIETPAYQRSFAWTEKQICRLLDNLSSAVDGTDHFLGAMLFIERERPSSRRPGWTRPRASRVLDVVDGLQRLTTLTILFCALRDLDAEDRQPPNLRLLAAISGGDGATARQRLLLREPEEVFFHTHVRKPGATLEAPPDGQHSPAGQRILEARGHIVAALRAYDAGERRKVVDFLLDRCHMVYVATTDIDRAHEMFTVLNDAGKPLARNDILKAELLGNVAREATAASVAIWDEAERLSGGNFEQLFSHIWAMFERPDGRVILGIREIAAESGGAHAFIVDVLGPAARIADDIRNARHTGSPHSAAITKYLHYLGFHSFSDWIPPAMLWWLEKGQDAGSLLRFLAKLDRFAFGMRLLGIGGAKRTRRFGAVISAIRNNRDLDAPDGVLAFSRQELRTMQHNVRNLHGLSASTAKHLLLRLTDAVAGQPQSLSLPDDMTVEHVLPKKLAAKSEWRKWHSDHAERERCTGSLGNLVLVTKDQNDKASNHEFARKLEIYFKTPGAPAVAINEGLRGRTEWKAREILAREAEMFQLIEELWQFGMIPPRAQAAE